MKPRRIHILSGFFFSIHLSIQVECAVACLVLWAQDVYVVVIMSGDTAAVHREKGKNISSSMECSTGATARTPELAHDKTRSVVSLLLQLCLI